MCDFEVLLLNVSTSKQQKKPRLTKVRQRKSLTTHHVVQAATDDRGLWVCGTKAVKIVVQCE